jgi:prepilin-type N-terminal cleavage/methylation domain-containing protein
MPIQKLPNDNAMKHDSPIVPTNLQKQRGKANGFSLIELLIAMALLLILAAMAVPNYLAAMARATRLQQPVQSERLSLHRTFTETPSGPSPICPTWVPIT